MHIYAISSYHRGVVRGEDCDGFWWGVDNGPKEAPMEGRVEALLDTFMEA